MAVFLHPEVSMVKHNTIIFVALILILCLFVGFGGERVLAQNSGTRQHEDYRVSNDLVNVIQSTRPDGEGRFVVIVNTDEGMKELLYYGNSSPWTSFTTIRIDGKDYVFGGPTARRAGRNASYGVIERHGVDEHGWIVMTVLFEDSIRVTQRVGIAVGLSTGIESSMLVEYEIENVGLSSRDVGVRILFDTKLGLNDGAPIRFGERVVTTDTMLTSSDIPVFWQAFDDLGQTSVVAEAVLHGRSLTPPDRMVISNWGNMADNLWDVPLVHGRDFSRDGEFVLDSAVALYWEPVKIAPGESRVYATQYGVGELSGVRGELSVALSSPVTVNEQEPFPLIAYVEGTLGKSAGVTLQLDLPEGWQLYGVNGPIVHLGDVNYLETRQVQWFVLPDGSVEKGVIRVHVVPENGSEVSVVREVSVQRHELLLSFDSLLEVPSEKGKLQAFLLRGTVTNVGEAPSPISVAELELWGASLSNLDSPVRLLPILQVGETAELSWAVVPNSRTDEVIASLRVRNHRVFETGAFILVPSFETKFEFYQEPMSREGWTKVVVYGYELPNFHEILLDISYTRGLDVVHVSKGEMMVVDSEVKGSVSYRIYRNRNHVEVVVHGNKEIKGTGPLITMIVNGRGTITIDSLQLYIEPGEIRIIPMSGRNIVVQ